MAVEQKVAQQNIITKYVVNKKHRFYSGVFAYNYHSFSLLRLFKQNIYLDAAI
jgi:hypothetical protein